MPTGPIFRTLAALDERFGMAAAIEHLRRECIIEGLMLFICSVHNTTDDDAPGAKLLRARRYARRSSRLTRPEQMAPHLLTQTALLVVIRL